MDDLEAVTVSHHLDVFAVTAYFIRQDELQDEPDVTPLKLHKLLYLAQANYLAATGERLFDEPIEAFDHGPVVYAVTRKFSGRQVIAYTEPTLPDAALPPDAEEFLERIWVRYKDYSPSALRALAHRQTPWKEYYEPDAYRSVIPDSAMIEYFRKDAPSDERVLHAGVTIVDDGFLDAFDIDATAAQLRSVLDAG